MNKKIIGLVLLVIGLAIVLFTFFSTIEPVISPPQSKTFWKYQCIDTMKTSRDRARELGTGSQSAQIISQQLSLIADTGANCVAIATPYDDEFLPYLRLWVAEARKQNLHVWFRGNWSSWEGWFGYSRGMTTQAHIEKTVGFIKKHPELFVDGDIFTGAPESENGGPFVNNNSPAIFPEFRSFLTQSYSTQKKAFSEINKKVEVNWLSMNGWIAQNMYDTKTLSSIGNTVTIDHYTKDLQGMKDYTEFFNSKFSSKVVLGEFGAPIPDLNGSMTQDQQADYVESLLSYFVTQNDYIVGLNYWTLKESSTGLVEDSTLKPKKVYSVLKKYYSPGVVYGRITNTVGEPIKYAQIEARDTSYKTLTADDGTFSLLIPSGTYTFTVSSQNYFSDKFSVEVSNSGEYLQRQYLIPQNTSFIYSIKEKLHKAFLRRT